MRRGIAIGLLLAIALRAAGAWFWRRWRAYGAGELPAELVRRSQ